MRAEASAGPDHRRCVGGGDFMVMAERRGYCGFVSNVMKSSHGEYHLILLLVAFGCFGTRDAGRATEKPRLAVAVLRLFLFTCHLTSNFH